MAVKNIAIIGCGVSGLTAIKCCLDAGLNPICFEQQSWLGGVWNYTEKTRANLASVHKTTVTNTSKVLTRFSDFPFPMEFPNFMPWNQLQEYLEMYAKNFGLEKYVQFSTEVVKLERSADYDETGKWVVSTRKQNENNSEITTTTFDAVMLCNGHYWDQIKPDIPGMEKFKGVKVHSGDYRTFHPYVGKKVVIVGCSHSGGDIAVELSYHADQVYISTRSGCYIFTRLGSGGQPFDSIITRATSYIRSCIPQQLAVKLIPSLLNNRYDFKTFGLQPTGAFDIQKFSIVNDTLLHRIITGSVKVKEDIKEITEDSVVFKGGETVNDVDALIMATGFKPNYQFAKDIIQVKDGLYLSLFEHIFLPSDSWHTLAVIGAVGVGGPVVPVCEMQARVAAEVFAGRCTLPSKADMKKEIEEREGRWMKTGASKYNYMRVSYVAYMDKLSEMIGARPNLWSIFKEDPKLAYQCFFNTAVPTQYRLQGPNTWQGAREAIMTIQEEILCPLKARQCQPSTEKSNFNILILIFLAAIAIVAVMLKA